MRLKNILIIGLVIPLFVASCMCMEDNSEKAFEYYNKGCDCYSKGDYATAVEYFDKALEIDPNYVEAWHNKAIELMKLERYDEAIECYDKLIELNPKDTGYWGLKIILLEKLGRYEEAIECISKIPRSRTKFRDNKFFESRCDGNFFKCWKTSHYKANVIHNYVEYKDRKIIELCLNKPESLRYIFSIPEWRIDKKKCNKCKFF